MTTKDKDMSEQSNELAAEIIRDICEMNEPENEDTTVSVNIVWLKVKLAEEFQAARAPLLARIAELEAKVDVDYIAQVIRMVDGNNSMGAGALAEAIVAAIRANE